MKTQFDQAVTTKDYSVISAPMDGQLGEVTPRVGQYVSAGTTVNVSDSTTDMGDCQL
jgi:multidrug resistance efflux pump